MYEHQQNFKFIFITPFLIHTYIHTYVLYLHAKKKFDFGKSLLRTLNFEQPIKVLIIHRIVTVTFHALYSFSLATGLNVCV